MFKAGILRMLRSFGYTVSRDGLGFSAEELDLFKKLQPYTATSVNRLIGLVDAVRYISANQIPGDFVECGVWRGGSMMAAMLTLLELKDRSRHFHLFDTYEGMVDPGEKDVKYDGQSAQALITQEKAKHGEDHALTVAGVEDVRRNVQSTGYPEQLVHLTKGRVEDTIPKHAPERIALLRLDTNWYQSTSHEIQHLYPRLSDHGILIIDDYGHWLGARQAIDEFFASQKLRPLLTRMDYTGRMAVKIPA